jgi:uncharacterized membrane protein
MKKKYNDKARLAAMLIISLLVIITGAMFSFGSFRQGEIAGGILGGVIAITILLFFIIVFIRGNSDIKKGFPLRDERSRKVLEKASSKAFYVSLYVLLGIGFLSDIIVFRDVSQATSISVGLMAILFAVFWFYYNRREL